MDIGVRMIDLALWTSGNFDVASVSATAYSKFGSRGLGEGSWGASTPEGIPFDVEDSASAFLRMRNGASVQIEVSWVVRQKEDDAHGVEIFGTEAGASLPPVEIYRLDKDVADPVNCARIGLPLSYPHCNRFVNFGRALQGIEQPCVTMDQALSVQQVIDVTFQSVAWGREVLL
jgi:predicted dehydrogenase